MQTTTTPPLRGLDGNPPTSRDGLIRTEIGDTAYGITFIPWDERIRLSKPVESGKNSPQFRGCLPAGKGNGPVPIFDLRTARPARGSRTNNAPAFLLIVSLCRDGFRTPMNVGLLVDSQDGQISPLPRFVLDHYATN